jgi:hypothetical protein
VSGWFIAILTALGALLMGLVKADLEDAAVCRWLARHLIYRAALRLPRRERVRWRDESLQNVLDLPGRLPPLLWALDIYVKSGNWARMRGAPSQWQMLMWRIRMPLVRRRARRAARAMLPSRPRHPAYNRTTAQALQVQAEPAHARAVALDATALAEARWPSWLTIPEGRWPSGFTIPEGGLGLPHVADEEFNAWLAQQRRDFENEINRQMDEYWRSRVPRLPS